MFVSRKELELYCKPTFEDLALPFACTAWSAYGALEH